GGRASGCALAFRRSSGRWARPGSVSKQPLHRPEYPMEARNLRRAGSGCGLDSVVALPAQGSRQVNPGPLMHARTSSTFAVVTLSAGLTLAAWAANAEERRNTAAPAGQEKSTKTRALEAGAK